MFSHDLSRYDISNGRLILSRKIYERNDTQIFTGQYYGMQCVIKKISVDENIGIKSKIIREVSFLKKIQHPNIIKLYGIMHDSENIYIVLEKGYCNISSISLGGINKDKIINDVLSGLKFIADNDYIHGDLSFRNIVVSKIEENENIYKIIDFGSATKSYRMLAIKRPTYYISPIEIIKGNKIIATKIDAWALGCLTYYLETGNVVVGKNIFNVIEEINYKDSNTKYLLTSDVNERYTINKYYEKVTDKLENDDKSIKKIKSSCSLTEMFNKVFNYNSTYYDHKLLILQDLLNFNIRNNIPIENIFITFKLIEKICNRSVEEYIVHVIILYYLTTKLVCMIEFNIFEIMSLINDRILHKIKSVKEFNYIVLKILFKLDWNIDVNTQISYVSKVKEEFRIKYLIVSLAILCDNKYNAFSEIFLHKIIMLIFECENNEATIKNTLAKCDNPYLALHFISNILHTLRKMKNDGTILGTVIKSYLESIGNSNFFEWVDKLEV